MSHGITKTDHMAYAKERGAPWHANETAAQLTELEHVVSSEEMIKAAGLDWEVELQPLVSQRHGKLHNWFEVVRMDTDTVLGLVRSHYKPIRNRLVFSFLDNLVASGQLGYETAGSLWGGAHIWALARMPEDIMIGGKDRYEKYLLAVTQHDGYGAMRGIPTAVRVVCNNTYNMALAHGDKRSLTFNVAHVGNPQAKIEQARKMMQTSLRLFGQFEKQGEKLLEVDGLPVVDKLLEALFPARDEMKPATSVLAKRDDFMEVVGEESRFSGSTSLYTLMNAVTGYSDHLRAIKGKSDDDVASRQFWFTVHDGLGGFKSRGLELLNDFYEQSRRAKVPVPATRTKKV